MPTATITCPHCSTGLTTAKSFAVGSRFRCPRCGAAFAVRPGDMPMQAGPRPVTPLPEYDDPPRRSGGWLILAGVVALAVLLLAGAGLVLALHFLPPKKDAPPVALAPAGSHPDRGDPSSPQPPPAPGGNTDKNDPQKHQPAPGDLPPGGPPPLKSEPPPPAWLPPEKQNQVNAAIDRGVAFLESKQFPGGTWELNHSTGMAALPGLTLLECGVPADDPHVQKAAEFVRGQVPNLNTTYELALAILFLDRLGDRKDEPLIQTMALRLMAGQMDTGGWSYNCPVLSARDEGSLLTILQATRPHTSLDLIAPRTGGPGIDNLFTGRGGDRPATPVGTIALPSGPTDEEVKQAKQLYDGLSPNLKSIPALKPPTDDNQMSRGDNTDNSNTQFATLGLWAAGRHGVPMERALARLGQRFQVSQTPHGGWDYHFLYRPQGGPEGPAMTGAGLLGLAVGHGVTADLKGADVQAAGEDPQVERGMKALAGYISNQPNGLYFMWSVERVGMLYGRKTIGDKEWYPWGVDFLLPGQQGDGSWRSGGYWGATPITDTCFALLFLKQANLARDLTTKLEFLTQVKDKDGH